MDVFSLDKYVIDSYRAFSRSFTKIRSHELLDKVNALYSDNRFWPEPLLQINPHYAPGGSIAGLISAEALEPECAEIFRDKWGDAHQADKSLKLRKHQEQAIGYAINGQSYVVTTGTGSGKSLCFFVPIVDAVLKAKKAGEGPRTRAIVIYPMNALANSQAKELEGYLGPDGGDLVTYARYTGQEGAEERERIKSNPPDILLTNYMMLELLMTRQSDLDRKVLANCEGLKFVVLDELHTYRGRQGADVAMLMRRLRARVGNPSKPPICVGTSATMASEGGEREKNEAVSRIASQIFGTEIGPDAVVTETLMRVTNPLRSGGKDMAGLAEAVAEAAKGKVGDGKTNAEFFDDALAIWVETRIGLKNVESKAERAKPLPLERATALLVDDAGCSPDICAAALRNALIGYSTPERDRVSSSKNQFPLFAFKLHQFVSGAGRLYATLHEEKSRSVTFSGQIFNPDRPDEEERLYPVHFCRDCGQEFHPVTLRNRSGRQLFEKREIDDIPVDGEEDDDGADWGFLMPEPLDPDFSFEGKDEEYPDTWLDQTPSGAKRLKSTYKKKRAQEYYVAPNGDVGYGSRRAWYLPGKFRFCPACRATNQSAARDINKLASLSGEGRSSATTILISTILRWMHQPSADVDDKSRKLLAFTDNRQDAALQAGHFNDFVFVALLRAAILAALKQHPMATLDEPDVGAAIQQALRFLATSEFSVRADEWLENTGVKGERRKEAEAILREGLQHRFWIDQRRGWRYTNPNLEQLGLVTARYKYLSDIAADDDEFASSPILSRASVAEREAGLRAILDHMRKGLAVNSAALERMKVENLAQRMRGLIKAPWNIEEEALTTATVFLTEPPKKKEVRAKDEEKILRGSPTSAIGRKLRDMTFGGDHISTTDVKEVVDGLLRAALSFGQVVEAAASIGGLGYQLAASTICYELTPDQTHAELNNTFFTDLYTTLADILTEGGNALFGFEGREHTAQVEGELRELREFRFRAGEEDIKQLAARQDKLKEYREDSRFLPALFCSPTMELGVDISAMNVVYLRNAPPTAANYAQRSGRAGRSGQAALILTYCAAQSPHDQYFFERKGDLVDGIVVPPSIDLRNQDLVLSHLHAEWLAASGAELNPKIPENLDMASTARPLRDDLAQKLASPATASAAAPMVQAVLDALAADYGKDVPRWFTPGLCEALVAGAPKRFHDSFDRWRGLLIAAERAIQLARAALDDYSISDQERRAAEIRLNMGEHQRRLLLSSQASQDNDFYLYRYLATEGFLPGYNFPRLPLMAYVQGGADGKSQRYIQRARFLALAEFGPHSLIYHEGRAFRVDRALLKEAGDRPDGLLTTQNRALCPACGASHDGEHPARCHVCNGKLSKSVTLTSLFRIENVGTRPAERITSNDEDRKRQGFEIQTTFAFDTASFTAHQQIKDADGDIAALAYAQAAWITRINKGLRRRKDKASIGFDINPKTGQWLAQPKDGGETEKRPDVLRQTIVPMVEDRKNALLVRFPDLWLAELPNAKTTLATLQHALARGIEAVFQLEEGEILVEPTPTKDDRRALLFYEAAEGGAGALAQVVGSASALARVAHKALEVMHFKADSFSAARKDLSELAEVDAPQCVAGCYRCVLSYFNQPDHEDIDRRDEGALRILLRMVHGQVTEPHPDEDESIIESPLPTGEDFPAPDAKPLDVAGFILTKVWRKARVVVLHPDEAVDEVMAALAGKGVKTFVMPDDPAVAANVVSEIKKALKG
ncbi:DEAD/DEAH box helicase [Cereibacter sphaeroides]|uniref:DEAD/DEAH box helicase n=1 Tax=Cereibacter sphaeroides TaxID=1063 RepID=UPI001F2B8142|nr:DEAD/DEAH box helicase [Cereibacter sphaeroides]MCE6967194.1 DEAD/DEAH box helicase [Cereibacter sphaeroides]